MFSFIISLIFAAAALMLTRHAFFHRAMLMFRAYYAMLPPRLR